MNSAAPKSHQPKKLWPFLAAMTAGIIPSTAPAKSIVKIYPTMAPSDIGSSYLR
jgi:hypothetical protein